MDITRPCWNRVDEQTVSAGRDARLLRWDTGEAGLVAARRLVLDAGRAGKLRRPPSTVGAATAPRGRKAITSPCSSTAPSTSGGCTPPCSRSVPATGSTSPTGRATATNCSTGPGVKSARRWPRPRAAVSRCEVCSGDPTRARPTSRSRATPRSPRSSTRPVAKSCSTSVSDGAAATTRSSSCSTGRTPTTTSRSRVGSTCVTGVTTTRATAAIRRRSQLDDRYGPTPPWHDVQLEVHGPGRRGSQLHVPRALGGSDTARPSQPVAARRRAASLVNRVVPSRCHLPRLTLHRAGRTRSRSSARIRPSGRPIPFAPDGERSIARAYLKAFRRARRLVYVEDQYLWSPHAARGARGRRCDASPNCTSSRSCLAIPIAESRANGAAARLGRVRVIDTLRRAGWRSSRGVRPGEHGGDADLRPREGLRRR